MKRTYDFYSLCLIPVFTLLLGFGFSLTGTNFSVIGNEEGHRLTFLLWGALTGNYFYLYTDTLMEKADCQDCMVKSFLFLTLTFFVTAVGLPYLPMEAPFISRLHVLISFLATLLLGAAQIRFLLVLQKKRGQIFRKQWYFLLFLCLGSAILFFTIGIVSSLLEIFVTIGTCLYLRSLHRNIEG